MTPIRCITGAALVLALTACGGSGGGGQAGSGPTIPSTPSTASGEDLDALELLSVQGTGSRPVEVTSDTGSDRDRAPERWRFELPDQTGLPAQILISATDLASGSNTTVAISTHLE
jgi:hypothetical protein